MRKFSQREQIAIQKMIEGTANSYSYVLFNVYNDINYSRNVEFCYGKDRSFLVFYRKDLNQVSDKELLEIENEIMEISLLISYLQANGFIYLIENTSVNVLDTAGGFMKEGLTPIKMELDSNIAKILYDSLNHRVFVGYTLRELAANDFMSIEERTLQEAKRQADAAAAQAVEAIHQTQVAKKQIWLSLVALIFSIVSIIIGVYSNVWVARHTMDVKIDSAQVETITEQMSAIEDKFDTLNIHLLKNQAIEEKANVPMLKVDKNSRKK